MTLVTFRFLLLPVCVGATFGCGGLASDATSGSPGAGGTNAGAGGGGSGGGGTAGTGVGGSGGACPVSPPAAGAMCATGLVCTYGDNPVPDCRQRFLCQNGAFIEATTGIICPKPGTLGCPMSDPTIGVSCGAASGTDFVCGYPDATVCVCATCVGGPACMSGPKTWHCGAPPAAPCPGQLPNEGTACTVDPGVTCTYGVACSQGGAVAQCQGGLWKWVPVPCPA